MVTTRRSGDRPTSVVDLFPTKHLAAPSVRDMPEPPASFRKVIGPGIIAAGVGMASGVDWASTGRPTYSVVEGR
jgi:hypothetical protein